MGKVLVACEFSGIVRDAFLRQGHDSISCDLLPTESPGPHYQGDVLDLLDDSWDLMIAHPPCTHLASSGAPSFSQKRLDGRQSLALNFVRLLLNAPIPRIALENPVSVISTHIRKPDQKVQPWWFGHPETKTTCLWLKNLPLLRRTDDVQVEVLSLPPNQRSRIHSLGSDVKDRSKIRSLTYPGMAEAMAIQWGSLL